METGGRAASRWTGRVNPLDWNKIPLCRQINQTGLDLIAVARGWARTNKAGQIGGVVGKLADRHRQAKDQKFQKQLSFRPSFAGSRLISDDRATRVCYVVCAFHHLPG